MRRAIALLLTALLLSATPALAGGEGGTVVFPQKAPEEGTDPGFDIAKEFFGLFLKGYLFTGAYVATYQEVDFEDTGRQDYARYWYRREQDPEAEKKHYKAIGRIFAEIKADLGLNSPKGAANLAPADDPDALPGLDY